MADKETKHEKFIRIVQKRMENVVIAISRLKTVGNKGAYDYTTEEAVEIKSVLQEQVDEVYSAFGVANTKTMTAAPVSVADTTVATTAPTTEVPVDTTPVAPRVKPSDFVLPEFGGPEWALVGKAYETLYENQGTPKEAESVKQAIADLREALST